MSRFRCLSQTPAEIASAKLQQEVSELLSAHSSTAVQKSLSSFVNHFKPARPIRFTSERKTESILKNARVQYFPPHQPNSRYEALKQAAVENSNSKQIVDVACREAQREVSIALKRVRNKQLRESMHVASQRALQNQIKKLDDNVDNIVEHYAIINDIKYQEEDERLRLQYHVQKQRVQNRKDMLKIREEIAQDRIEQGRKAKEVSLINLHKIRIEQEENIIEKVQKYKSAQAEKKQAKSKSPDQIPSSFQTEPKQTIVEAQRRSRSNQKSIEVIITGNGNSSGNLNGNYLRRERSGPHFWSNSRPVSTKAASPGSVAGRGGTANSNSNRMLRTMNSTMTATPNASVKVQAVSSPKPTIQDQFHFVTKVINKLKDEELKIEQHVRHSLSEKIKLKTELGLIRAPIRSTRANTVLNSSHQRLESAPPLSVHQTPVHKNLQTAN